MPSLSHPPERRVWGPESGLVVVFVTLAVAVGVRSAGPAPAVLVSALALVYCHLVSWVTARDSRARLAVNFVAAWVLYGLSSFLVENLRLTLRHHELLAEDTALFGGTPSALWQGTLPPWGNDLLSAAYLSYHIYMTWAVVDALCRPAWWRERFNRAFVIAFTLCIPGYFLFPSGTPAAAFPELFAAPVAGGFLTRANAEICGALAARYDAFPSLHVFLTLVLLAWDFRMNRIRFRVVAIPALLMAAATLALRYHFAVDLLASLVLFLLWLLLVRPKSFAAPSPAA